MDNERSIIVLSSMLRLQGESQFALRRVEKSDWRSPFMAPCFRPFGLSTASNMLTSSFKVIPAENGFKGSSFRKSLCRQRGSNVDQSIPACKNDVRPTCAL
ncbi:Hypothetical predicted protein [Cloeon dipterum]|uniref:Uncharacterized protein n=1 Tax=Cloeon dipterum TaxID=197152 RepID=A0A8S1CBK3_9INSE|nr:Hypothetical predicted protein [Cloeon dipterum]